MRLAVPQDPYQHGWISGQADLVAALLIGELTLRDAAANLNSGQLGPKGSKYHKGWHDGQLDLIRALWDKRITLRAAAINLGVRAPDELPSEEVDR